MQKKKIHAYLKAKKIVDEGGNVQEAMKSSRISPVTYYKYKRMFGDNEPNAKGQIELVQLKDLPRDNNTRPMKLEKELDLILKENNALAEQLKLRKELARYVQ